MVGTENIFVALKDWSIGDKLIRFCPGVVFFTERMSRNGARMDAFCGIPKGVVIKREGYSEFSH